MAKTKKIIRSIKGGCISYDKGKDKLTDIVTKSIKEVKDDTVIIDYDKFLSNLIWGADGDPEELLLKEIKGVKDDD